MDIDKLAERIMSRIEEDRCIHKSSLVEEIQKALAPKKWDPPQPAMTVVGGSRFDWTKLEYITTGITTTSHELGNDVTVSTTCGRRL